MTVTELIANLGNGALPTNSEYEDGRLLSRLLGRVASGSHYGGMPGGSAGSE